MRATVFTLTDPEYRGNDITERVSVIYRIPILPAYAILSYSLTYKSFNTMAEGVQPSGEMSGDALTVFGVGSPFPGEVINAVLTVYYSGIRDYQLLFPTIANQGLRARTALFAEEADKAFDTGSWMSFTVMVASVVEGVLGSFLGKGTLNVLREKALKAGLITSEESGLLHNARNARNAVHAGKINTPYPDRKFGSDLYVLYDKMLKKRWDIVASQC